MSNPTPDPRIEPGHSIPHYSYVGQGGEHWVYATSYGGKLTTGIRPEALAPRGGIEIPHAFSDDRLATVVKFVVGELIECNRYAGSWTESFDIAEQRAEQRNNRYKDLVNSFGAHRVLGQISVPMSVEVGDETRKLLAQFVPDIDQRGAVCTVATYQPLVPELLKPSEARKTFSFHFPYMESAAPTDPSEYADFHMRWMMHPMALPSDAEIRQFRTLHPQSGLEPLFGDGDHLSLLMGMGEFVGKSIKRYSLKLRTIVDCVGPDNVIFDPNGGGYLLVDALFPSDCKHLDLVPRILMKIHDGWALTRREEVTLLNGLSYMRTMNFAAALLDLPERIEVLQELPCTEEVWRRVHERLSNLSERKALHDLTLPHIIRT